VRPLLPRLAALLLAAWPGAGAILAQEIEVAAEVDRARVRLGQALQLTIIVSGAASGQVSRPDLSRLTDFDIVGGPSVASSFRWINGRTESSRTFTYALRPKRSGTLRIPPLGILHEGRTYRTGALQVTVLPGGAQPPPDPRQPGGQRPPPGAGRGGAAPPPAEVRLKVEVDRRSAVVGEQITVRFLLASQTELLNFQLAENPTFPGFWTEEVELPENLELKRVRIDGELYNELTLMKKVLFPTSAGRLTIPAVTYRVQVRRRSQDPFESFFFTPTETLMRSSEPVAIDVRPLPEEGRPAGFSGAVGRFEIAVAADRQEARVNDAVGLRVTIAGEGSLNAVPAPPIDGLSDFKKLEPKVTSGSTVRGDTFRSEKVWDYVVIPLAAGEQEIPPVTFTYYDPHAKGYRELASGAIPIRVARGDGPAGGAIVPVAQSDVRRLGSDIHYIKLAPGGLADRSGLFHRSPLFAALVLVPLLADAGIAVAVRLRAPSRERSRLRRERRARAAARRRLKEARRRLSPATSRAFYAAVAQALTGYVADKFDAAGAGLTHQRIEELLAGHGAAETERAAFHRSLEACDFARFAPASSGEAEMRRALESAEQVLVALERSLQA
jgi:hypothetical protein